MSDDMSNHGVIPCAILVDNFASGLRAAPVCYNNK
jgi:hypothetical protein